MKTKNVRRFTGLFGIALLLASGATLGTRAISEPPMPLNVLLTTAAWDAFNGANYDKAAAFADSCIAEFRGTANEDQAQLEETKAPLPPKGKATEAQKQEIHARGPLNDVGTCFFIKGKAYEALGRLNEAKKAYLEAKRLTYARCWDPQGWFWSPSVAASGRIAEIDAKANPSK